jgi:glycosyltransferase involved in cell wall biosynthesis
MDVNDKFIIIMPTYRRSNGKTLTYLKRSLNSIASQKYTNWDLVVVGDKYENEEELLNLLETFRTTLSKDGKAKNEVIYIRNTIVERDFIANKNLLWFCAGAMSINMGLFWARANGYKYYCHLDDDDYWKDNHISEIAKVYSTYPECVFVNTRAHYLDILLPKEEDVVSPNNRKPEAGKMVHSSFSFDIQRVPFYHETAIKDHGIVLQTQATDAILLARIAEFIEENPQYCSVSTPAITCVHDEECESITM